MGVEVYCIVAGDASCETHEKHIVEVELEKPLLWSPTGRIVFSERTRVPISEAYEMLERDDVLYINYNGKHLPLRARTLSCDHATVRPVGRLISVEALPTCE